MVFVIDKMAFSHSSSWTDTDLALNSRFLITFVTPNMSGWFALVYRMGLPCGRSGTLLISTPTTSFALSILDGLLLLPTHAPISWQYLLVVGIHTTAI